MAHKDHVIRGMPSLAKKTYSVYAPIPENSPVAIEGQDMGYLGGPSIVKGYDVLYSALKHVRNKLTVHMMGGFPDDTKDTSRCKIVFHGRLSGESFVRVYKQINTVIVPSVWQDPLPYVVSEAVLNGRLVIASNVGGIPELVDGCPGAFLFPPSDYQALAKVIDHVSSLDHETVLRLRTKNIEAFLNKFDNNRLLQDFERVLNTVCNSPA
jgi:glycosyltransferase involved in cell wall biosynthesis